MGKICHAPRKKSGLTLEQSDDDNLSLSRVKFQTKLKLGWTNVLSSVMQLMNQVTGACHPHMLVFSYSGCKEVDISTKVREFKEVTSKTISESCFGLFDEVSQSIAARWRVTIALKLGHSRALVHK